MGGIVRKCETICVVGIVMINAFAIITNIELNLIPKVTNNQG